MCRFPPSKTTTFNYAPDTKLYGVKQYKAAYADGNTNEIITLSNVLILKTTIHVISGDDKGRIDVQVTGIGSGIFFSGGKYEQITWQRENSSAPFTLKNSDGTPLRFSKGKTYVCVIDADDSVMIQ